MVDKLKAKVKNVIIENSNTRHEMFSIALTSSTLFLKQSDPLESKEKHYKNSTEKQCLLYHLILPILIKCLTSSDLIITLMSCFKNWSSVLHAV